MKILVYGAGLIGSIVASQLKKNEYDVTILARGQHAENLRSFGIVTHAFEGDDYCTVHPPVVESLTPEDIYDVILVIMRRNNHEEILPILSKNSHYKKVVFLGNNVGGASDIVKFVDAKKVALGFGGTTGERRGDVIYHYAADEKGNFGKFWLGELDQSPSLILLELQTILENAGFETEISPDIDAWLKTHAAIVLPIAFGLYLCDGDNFRLSRTRDAIVTTFRGIKEGLKVLRKLQVSILPQKYQLFSLVPEPVAVAYLRTFFNTDFARVGLAVHANNAKDEMFYLANEFKTLITASGVDTPHLNHLFAVTDQTQEDQIILPEGSKSKPLDWKPIWIGAGILTGILGALGFILTQQKKRK
ncbi:MAG: 2-dehydropantoate 2-reductase N-terminal domain-containing protein [Anaerolineae bacterium]|jgi:2-dehydropantoate 2-reductase|nr:2-dehydropantoate 2-reductase N-terminal domain-containing protein [Anaerolineae bacterium]